MRWLGLVLLATGCGAPVSDALDGIVATSAQLLDLSTGGAAVVGGKSSGTATLFVVDAEGGAHELPVVFEGWILGALIDVHGGFAGDVPLSLPDGPVAGRDLLGDYDGSLFAGHLVLGVQSRTLSNAAGVTLDATQFGVGLGLGGGAEWVRIDVDAPADGDDDDGASPDAGP